MSSVRAAPFSEVLTAAGHGIQLGLDEVEGLLLEVTSSHGEEVERFSRATLAAGGKRLRPLLVLICGDAGGRAERPPALVRAAAAVELVHMATLVHDDVLDAALVRRGHPTVYASDGRGAATATGDFLFSRAFALLTESGDAEQVRLLSDASVALARGELIQRQDAFARRLSVERYLHRCDLKTASLFATACRIGSLAAGRPVAEGEALGRFGRGVGLAFQLLDDVLDVSGTAERTGKHRGTDLLDGTRTLPLILAARHDPSLALVDLRSIATRDDAEALCERIASTGALEEVTSRAESLVEEAESHLEILEPRLAELLRLVAQRIVARSS